MHMGKHTHAYIHSFAQMRARTNTDGAQIQGDLMFQQSLSGVL